MKKKQQLKIGFPFPILSFYDFKIINISPSFFIYFILFIYFGGRGGTVKHVIVEIFQRSFLVKEEIFPNEKENSFGVITPITN